MPNKMASCEDVSDTKFPTGQETVSFLATEMAKLNAQQISEALEDLHGVSSFKPVAETPQLVQIKFAEFESKISKNKNKAYKMAEDISKKYVQNPDLRIRYLRCESYDVCKAVARFMSMFEQKLLYFGPSLLAQDIRLSDLSKDEIKILESGMIQELDQTDSSGRTVVVFLKELHPLVEGVDKYMRAFFYFFFSAMAKRRELESQGVVTVFVCNDRPSFDGGSRKEIGKPQQPSPDLPLKLSQLRRTYPFRNDCVHGCMQDRESLSIFGFLLRRLNHFERARSLCHIGNSFECHHQLKAYGIPINCFPMDVNGNFNTHNHKNWMKRRRQEESFSNQVTDSVSLSIASGILENRRQNVEMASRLRLDFGTAGFQQHPHPHTVQVLTSSSNPRPQDVLLGRGNNTLYHQGNIRFREVIEQYVDDYYRIHKAARRLLGVQIVHKFLQTGTRFLKLGANDQGWIPVDEKAAYVKVCQSFRTLKRTKG